MDNVFCTLFDSNYLDKGLVLYDSMCKYMSEFKLYVFAFDSKCFDILKAENLKNLIVVSSEELETVYPCLKEAKKDRNSVEYSWTCSPWTIKYVLEQYSEEICTYIDADMCFFSSPAPVFERMRDKKCSIIVVPHRFHTDKFEKSEGPKTGYYCVEFNTFMNDQNGKEALDWWAEECCKWCHYTVPSVDKWYGDQKYLNEFPKRFNGVYVCDHYGVGFAPWNDNRMKLISGSGEKVVLVDKQSKLQYPLVIYHFSGVKFLSERLIKVPSRMTSKKFHQAVFDDYVNEIVKKRAYIKEKHGLEMTKSQGFLPDNPILRIYIKYVCPIIKLRHLYNLYRVKE